MTRLTEPLPSALTLSSRHLMDEVVTAAESFPVVSLEEIGKAALMDRLDAKFLLPAISVPEILNRLGGDYRILEVGGHRLSRYSTRYFDTPDLAMYHAHHAGRKLRHKVRVRTYVDSETRFLEVKQKTNRGRTRKARVSLAHETLEPMARLEKERLLGITDVMSPSDLSEAMVVDYTRLTLVRNDAPERVTLDLMLSFSRLGQTRRYPGVVVAEVKQERRDRSSFLDAIRAFNIREGSLSKYCLGIASLEPSAKKNRFNEGLRRLERIDGMGLHNAYAIPGSAR